MKCPTCEKTIPVTGSLVAQAQAQAHAHECRGIRIPVKVLHNGPSWAIDFADSIGYITDVDGKDLYVTFDGVKNTQRLYEADLVAASPQQNGFENKPCTKHTGGTVHMHAGDRTAYQYASCESNRRHQDEKLWLRQEAEFDETAFVTEGNSDETQINRMMLAIFDERCPGIRFSAGDAPHYRAAAIAALTALGILTAKAIDIN
jgi:hypothetical protein